MQENNFSILEALLDSAENKYQLDIAMNCLLEMIETNKISQDIPKKIQQIFRDKIFNLVVLNGEVVNKLYLALYVIYKDIADKDERFAKIESIAQNAMFQQDMSDNENLMLLELAVLAKILGGRAKEALDFYIQKIVLIDIHSLESQKSAEFILQAFKYFDIPFETLKANLLLIFENFQKLNYKQKRSFFNWQLHVFWNVPHYFNHKGWLDFYDKWKEVFYQELEVLDTSSMDFALYVHFFIYHMCGNNFSSQKDWQKFNKEITLVATNAYKDFAKNFTLPIAQKQNSGVIGILRDRLVENSPYKVEFSFLKTLMENKDFKDKYKIKLYVMSFLEKSDNDPRIMKSYQDLGIEVLDIGEEYNKAGYYNSHLAKALALRENILRDNVEFLISPNNGYGISDFLLATRSCLKQFFWSHGNFVYDGDFLDLKITHICGNQKRITHQGFNFYGIPVKMDTNFYNPDIDSKLLEKTRALYPSDVKIFGNIGRLVKIDDETYLKTIITILKNNDNAVFLACGAGNVDEIKAKISKIDSQMLHRFYFTGFVDSAVYGHIIDIWLDSFPMEQGESRIEFSAKDRPSLVLSKETREQRETRLESWFEMHKEYILPIATKYQVTQQEIFNFLCKAHQFVAFNIDEYILKAQEILMLSSEELKLAMLKQRIIKETNDLIREKLGKDFFLEILGS